MKKKPHKPGRVTLPRHPVRKPQHRLDTILVEKGLFTTRSQAGAAILAGLVLVEGNVEHKAGRHVTPDIPVEVVEDPVYVSRGGYKLERAFDAFDLNVAGKVVLDAGASTGGFTDCLLQNDAARVIAIDVGYGQLDWKLRQDPRVTVMERTNVRYLDCADLPELPQMATLDLSFISLKKVLPAITACMPRGYEVVTLIKPQFEAGRSKVGKGGVVRDPEVHRAVLSSIWDFAGEAGMQVRGLVDSPVRGPKGNIEYLMYMIDGSGYEAMTEEAAVPHLDKDEVIGEVLNRARETHNGHLFGREHL